MKSKLMMTIVVALAAAVSSVSLADPLGSEFTFQGQLKQAGVPFDGTADLDFTLWDAETVGNQIGTIVTLLGVTVTDGLFTVELDFGAAAFNGEERWLDVTVNGTPLSPRQKLTAAPYAIQTRGLVVDDNGNVTLAPSNGNSASSSYAAAVGGGAYNAATGAFSTIGGGEDSSAAQASSTIGGGAGNRIGASGLGGTIAGGVSNTINGNGIGQTIGGGEGNTADGDSATVPGGSNNAASGFTSFAAGRRAKANHNGAFVWADSTNADFASTGTNQFLIRAAGGVGINKNDPATALDVAGTVAASAFVGDGSGLTNLPVANLWSETGPDIFYDTGKVGIGETNPSAKLTVVASTGGDTVLVENTGTAGAYATFRNDASEGFQIGLNSTAHPDPSTAVLNAGSGDMKFLTNNGERMRILSNGNIGIGTTTPSAALDVVGGIEGSTEGEIPLSLNMLPIVQDQAHEGIASFTYDAAWQSFTAGMDGHLAAVDVYRNANSSDGPLNIYEGEGTAGTLLATVTADDFTGWQRVTIDNGPLLVSGNVYTIHLPGPSATWHYSTSGTYPGGRASGNAAWDHAFRTHMAETGGAAEVGFSVDGSSNVRTNNGNIYPRGGTDVRNGLGYFGLGTNKQFAGEDIDGTVLWGERGGALGTAKDGRQRIALEWDSSFRVGVGRSPNSNQLEVEGDASKTVAGSWLANSDRRIKQNIETIGSALDTLDEVRLVSFEYTDDYRKDHPSVDSGRYLNVIAQEFAEVFPEHVKGSGEFLPDGSEILQVDTYPLTIYSAAAIQELRMRNTEKDSVIADLTTRLERMEAMMAKLVDAKGGGAQ